MHPQKLMHRWACQLGWGNPVGQQASGLRQQMDLQPGLLKRLFRVPPNEVGFESVPHLSRSWSVLTRHLPLAGLHLTKVRLDHSCWRLEARRPPLWRQSERLVRRLPLWQQQRHPQR
jgi:hypothetical protein